MPIDRTTAHQFAVNTKTYAHWTGSECMPQCCNDPLVFCNIVRVVPEIHGVSRNHNIIHSKLRTKRGFTGVVWLST